MSAVDLSEVVRRVVGRVGVDAGQVALSSPGVHTELSFGDSDVLLRPGYVVVSSGYGDGVYDVVELRATGGGPDVASGRTPGPVRGAVVGVEVVFIADEVDDAVSELVAVFCPDVVKPSEEVLRAAYADGDADALGLCRRFDVAWSDVAEGVWEHLLCDAAPSGVPEVVGSLDVDGELCVGDPCHGVPELRVPVPSGVYDVVVWRTDGSPSARVARLAARRRSGE